MRVRKYFCLSSLRNLEGIDAKNNFVEVTGVEFFCLRLLISFEQKDGELNDLSENHSVYFFRCLMYRRRSAEQKPGIFY